MIHDTGLPGLSFVASGPLSPDPAQLLNGATLPEMLDLLAKQFDVVVLDGPPVLALSDSPRLGATAAATLFIVEANGSHRGGAKLAIRRLLASRANLVGAILTKFDARQIGYGASSSYENYYSYGEPERG